LLGRKRRSKETIKIPKDMAVAVIQYLSHFEYPSSQLIPVALLNLGFEEFVEGHHSPSGGPTGTHGSGNGSDARGILARPA
jgi:hypothetical protein